MEPDLPLNVRLKIDAVCDLFEQQWRLGTPPSIDPFLVGWSGSEREALLAELEGIDREYRQQQTQSAEQGAALCQPVVPATMNPRMASR